MKQTQIPPTPPQDKEPDNNNRSLSSLWNLWVGKRVNNILAHERSLLLL